MCTNSGPKICVDNKAPGRFLIDLMRMNVLDQTLPLFWSVYRLISMFTEEIKSKHTNACVATYNRKLT